MSALYRHNIPKITLVMIASDTTFSFGIFAVFLLFTGLTLGQMATVISTFLIFSSIGQIPSGILADRVGYKKTIIFGCVLFLIGTIIFALGQTFAAFLIGYALMGLGASMEQGADQALLYEGLESEGSEKLYKKYLGRMYLYTNTAIVVASIIGGVLYMVNQRLPFYGEIVIAGLAVLAALALNEPPKPRPTVSVIKQLRASFHQAFGRKDFSKVFLFSALIGSIALTTFKFEQPFFKVLEINEIYFGIIAAFLFILRGIGSWFSHAVGHVLSIDKYLILHACIFGLFLIFIQKTDWIIISIGIMGVFHFLRGLYNPTISSYINERVDNTHRATLLSTNRQILTLISSISLIGLGYFASLYDIHFAFFVLSVMSMIFIIAYILSLRKIRLDS